MNSIIKGVGYCLNYTPGLMLQHGSTIATERVCLLYTSDAADE